MNTVEMTEQEAITILEEKYAGLELLAAKGEFLVSRHLHDLPIKTSLRIAKNKVYRERIRYLIGGKP